MAGGAEFVPTGSRPVAVVAEPAAAVDSRAELAPTSGTEAAPRGAIAEPRFIHADFWRNHTAVMPHVSVIVPTRNEAVNVRPLLRAFEEIAAGLPLELIFVDDSDDETPREVQQAGENAPFSVACLHRRGAGRTGGLGGAVIEGMRLARAEWVCVIDGDLQHPPATVPLMLEAGRREDADVVVATRYRDGGSVGSFSLRRRMVSRGSSLFARILFPRKLQNVSDPMSGFFAVRRDAINLAEFRPQGFKILLEILVRTPNLKVAEVGFEFGERHAGDSNANLSEGARFLRLLWQLRLDSAAHLTFAAFLAVGLSGVGVNLGATAFFTEVLGVNYIASNLLATQVSSSWNFALLESLVFAGRGPGGRLKRFLRFDAVNSAAFLIRGPLIFALTEVAGIHYLISSATSLAALTLGRFGLAGSWIWNKDRS